VWEWPTPGAGAPAGAGAGAGAAAAASVEESLSGRVPLVNGYVIAPPSYSQNDMILERMRFDLAKARVYAMEASPPGAPPGALEWYQLPLAERVNRPVWMVCKKRKTGREIYGPGFGSGPNKKKRNVLPTTSAYRKRDRAG
jgi:hypothetical protein